MLMVPKSVCPAWNLFVNELSTSKLPTPDLYFEIKQASQNLTQPLIPPLTHFPSYSPIAYLCELQLHSFSCSSQKPGSYP